MMTLQNRFLSFLLLCFTGATAQYTDEINSNRPGNSMSAFSVGKSVIQTEDGLNYINEKHNLMDYTVNGYSADMSFRYGFYRDELEAILSLNYQNDHYVTDWDNIHRKSIKTTTLGAKYLFYDPQKNYKKPVNLYSWKNNHKYNWHQLIPALAGYAGFNINTSNSLFFRGDEPVKKLTPKIMLISQNQFPGNWVFVTNIFADQITSPYHSYGYVVTLTKGFNDSWSGFFENRGIVGNYYSDGIFTAGAAYLLASNMQVDASISRNYKDTPKITYFGIGFSCRFDDDYSDLLLRIPKKKDKGKKDKSKQGKAKEKEKEKVKKRLDEVPLKP
ncbi:transporter [Flavobacterium aciduliphilum]|nr:transporter [Flavobacterium aciduliphilum]